MQHVAKEFALLSFLESFLLALDLKMLFYTLLKSDCMKFRFL